MAMLAHCSQAYLKAVESALRRGAIHLRIQITLRPARKLPAFLPRILAIFWP